MFWYLDNAVLSDGFARLGNWFWRADEKELSHERCLLRRWHLCESLRETR